MKSKIWKRIVTTILMVTLLMSIVPTGEMAEAKSKYTWDKKFNTTVNYKKLDYDSGKGGKVDDGDGKYHIEPGGEKRYSVDMGAEQANKGNLLEVGEKFKITFKNLPEGAKIKLEDEILWNDGYNSCASILALTQNQLDDWRWCPQTFGDEVTDWVKLKIDNKKGTVTVYVKEPPKKQDLEHEIGMYQNGGFYAKDVLAYPCSVRLCFEITEKDGKRKHVSFKIPQLNLKEAVDLGFKWEEYYFGYYR